MCREYTQRARHGRHAIADTELQFAPCFAIQFRFEHVTCTPFELDTHRAAQRHHAPHADDDAVAMS